MDTTKILQYQYAMFYPYFTLKFRQHLLLALLSLSAQKINADPTPFLSKGKMHVGGFLSFPFEYDNTRTFSLGLRLEPEYGYFVINQLEIVGAGFAQTQIYRSDEPPGRAKFVRWGGQVGANYYFDLHSSFFPYTGLHFGVHVNNLDAQTGQWFFEVPVGALFLINDRVGIRAGFPLQLIFWTNSIFHKITAGPVFLGVMVFF